MKTKHPGFELYVPYEKIEEIERVKGVGVKGASTADLAGKQLEITYQNDLQHRICVRFEMAVAKLIGWGDVRACEEMMNFIKSNGIMKKFQSPQLTSAHDIPAQIKQLAELRDAGVLTDEEFEKKKAELLARL